MREILGLEALSCSKQGILNSDVLAALMRQDLAQSHLQVFSESVDEKQRTVLANLALKGEINYDQFSKRLEMLYLGAVLDEAIPLTYAIKGKQLLIRGRCSVIPKVCGVDLYFSQYSRKSGSQARQKIIFSISDLIKSLK